MFYTNLNKGLEKTLVDLFDSGDMSNWPDHIFPDPTLTQRQSKFFSDQSFIPQSSSSEGKCLKEAIYAYTRIGINHLALYPEK